MKENLELSRQLMCDHKQLCVIYEAPHAVKLW